MKHGVFNVRARAISGLRSERYRSLLAKMPKAKPRKPRKPRKRLRPRGFFGRWKWILIPVLVLPLIPAMQVAVVRFINPPVTLPILIDQSSAMFSIEKHGFRGNNGESIDATKAQIATVVLISA